jgi:hypothetical protein
VVLSSKDLPLTLDNCKEDENVNGHSLTQLPTYLWPSAISATATATATATALSLATSLVSAPGKSETSRCSLALRASCHLPRDRLRPDVWVSPWIGDGFKQSKSHLGAQSRAASETNDIIHALSRRRCAQNPNFRPIISLSSDVYAHTPLGVRGVQVTRGTKVP